MWPLSRWEKKFLKIFVINYYKSCPTENTEGEFCQFCAEGSFGNATESSIGCQKCFCNGHQNLPAGICDKETGHCFCLDNTQGKECEKCKMGFYGDPRNGGHCYHQCQSKSIIENESSGYLGCSGNLFPLDCFYIQWGTRNSKAHFCIYMIYGYLRSSIFNSYQFSISH